MSYENKRLTIVITDTGISFNPLERQEPDLTIGRTPDRRPRNLSGQATDDGSQL